MLVKTSGFLSLISWTLLGSLLEAFVLFFLLPVLTQHLPDLYQSNHFPDGYDLLASNILAGNGYRFFPDTSETLLRTPGYPLFLTLVFYFFPNSLVAVKIVNLTLGLFTAWIVAILTWRLTAHKTASILASFLFLIHPATIFAQSRGGAESLFTLLTTGFVLALCQAYDRKKLLDFVVAGILLGMATIVKSTPIWFPAFLFGLVLLKRQWHSAFKYWMPRLALLLLGMLIVLAPWIVRNYSLVHQFVPTMTVAGTAAFDGLHACKNYSLGADMGKLHLEASRLRDEAATQLNLPHRSTYFQYFYQATDEVRFNQYLLSSMFDEYRKSPTLLLRCTLLNVYNFWFAGRTWSSTYLNMLVQIPYLILAAMGIYFCIRNGYLKQMVPILAFAAYFFLIHLPINGIARYSVPLIPFLAIFTGIAFDELRRRLAMRRSDRVET